MSVAVQLEAQFGFGGGRNFRSVRLAQPEDIDGRFQFCRAVFDNDNRCGDSDGNWSVDYPRADINLSIRLAELTKTSVSLRDGEPNHLTIRLTDPAMFGCPFIMMTEVGSASIQRARGRGAARCTCSRAASSGPTTSGATTPGSGGRRSCARCCRPPSIRSSTCRRRTRSTRAQFVIAKTPQISNIGTWCSTGGGTSERGAESAMVNTRAILDEHGHIMVLMTHNTDLGDSFEREADDPQYFLQMSVPGYAFGVNTLLYALTH